MNSYIRKHSLIYTFNNHTTLMFKLYRWVLSYLKSLTERVRKSVYFSWKQIQNIGLKIQIKLIKKKMEHHALSIRNMCIK